MVLGIKSELRAHWGTVLQQAAPPAPSLKRIQACFLWGQQVPLSLASTGLDKEVRVCMLWVGMGGVKDEAREAGGHRQTLSHRA